MINFENIGYKLQSGERLFQRTIVPLPNDETAVTEVIARDDGGFKTTQYVVGADNVVASYQHCCNGACVTCSGPESTCNCTVNPPSIRCGH